MFLLYVDESGDPNNLGEENFVLGGIAVFERQTYWLSQRLDALEVEIFGEPLPTDHPEALSRPIEFHASNILSRRRAPWDRFSPEEASGIVTKLANVVTDSHESCALFAVVVHRPSYPNEDPVRFAFDELTRRFDLFLRRLHAAGDTQRGLMVFDESRHEKRLQTLLRSYTVDGGPFGRLVNFADVPLFADSKASRLLQVADFVAWATYRRYERGDARYFDPLVSRFDAENHRLHGLYHRTGSFRSCYCPACFSRRAAGSPPEPSP